MKYRNLTERDVIQEGDERRHSENLSAVWLPVNSSGYYRTGHLTGDYPDLIFRRPIPEPPLKGLTATQTMMSGKWGDFFSIPVWPPRTPPAQPEPTEQEPALKGVSRIRKINGKDHMIISGDEILWVGDLYSDRFSNIFLEADVYIGKSVSSVCFIHSNRTFYRPVPDKTDSVLDKIADDIRTTKKIFNPLTCTVGELIQLMEAVKTVRANNKAKTDLDEVVDEAICFDCLRGRRKPCKNSLTCTI